MAQWQSTLRMMTLGILLGPGGVEMRAEESSGAQVLFSFDRKDPQASTQAASSQAPLIRTPTTELPTEPPTELRLQSIAKVDPAVVPTSHEANTPAAPLASDRRRLAPLSSAGLRPGSLTADARGKLPFEIPHVDSLGTAGAGLALVVGLFLLCVSLMRRGGPSPTSPLPSDAVSVLGRIPLAPKQFAHLIHVGNKLVLVSITGDRTDTITEVTEPAEVERLLVMCLKGSRQSSSAEFQKLLAQMSKEPARGFLGREAGAYSRPPRG